MTRPNEEADRLWIQASQLRLIADEIEARAAALRPSRTPMDHHRYFRLLVERDCRYGPSCDHSRCAECRYCRSDVHPHDAQHTRRSIPPSDNDLGRLLAEMTDTHGCAETAGRCAHIDHIVPVAAGGTNDLPNLALACVRCNLQKRAGSAEDFRVRKLLEALEARSEAYLFLGRPSDAMIAEGLLDFFHDLFPESLWPTWVRVAMAGGEA